MSPQRRTRRLQVGLSPGERDVLQQLAASRHEPEATTAARLLRATLAEGGATLGDAPRHRAGPPRGKRGERQPRRIEGLDAIDALRARYPVELRHLPAEVVQDALVSEQIAALATWREQLDDDQAGDPRMELWFGRELREFAQWLQHRARRAH